MRSGMFIAVLVIAGLAVGARTSARGSWQHQVRADGAVVGRQANGGLWRSLRGPEGGSVLALAVDPGNREVVYAGTDHFNGVFKSIDGGRSWRAARSGLTFPDRSGTVDEVEALVVDPRQTQTVYAGTGQGTGVFKSTDGGKSWRPANGIKNPFPTSSFVNALVLDPGNDSVIYAGTSDGVFKTTNAGRTWALIRKDLWANALVIDPENPNTIYAGALGDGIFKSTNGGRTWREANAGLPSRDGLIHVWSLAVDPQHPQTVYAGTSGGLYQSQDGGSAWLQLGARSLGDGYVSTVAVDPLHPQTLYAATMAGVSRSDDGGQSWHDASAGLEDPTVSGQGTVQGLVLDPANSGRLYAATRGGVYTSSDGGSSWQPSNHGLVAQVVRAIALAGGAAKTIYAATDDGVFKSTNGGASWQPAGVGVREEVDVLAIDPDNPRLLYAGTNDGLFTSTDGGESWQQAKLGPPGKSPGVRGIAIAPHTPTTVYLATRKGLYRTTDRGTSWAVIGGQRFNFEATDFSAVALDPRSPNTIYAVGLGVFKSTDDGQSWRPVNKQATAPLAVDPHHPQTVYAGSSRGLFKTTDGGQHWNRPRTSRKLDFLLGEGALAIDPHAARTIYAANFIFGVYRSRDGARSWQPFNQGLTNKSTIETLAIDATGATLYAGTDSGVFTHPK